MPSSIFPSLAPTPEPPYYAVIFTSVLRDVTDHDYEKIAKEMVDLVAQQKGFLGLESFRDADGVGVTISYWKDEASIKAWKEDVRHKAAQDAGYQRFYKCFKMRIALVERDYGWLDEGEASAIVL